MSLGNADIGTSGKVIAGAESLAGTSQDNNPDLGVILCLFKGGVQVPEQRVIQGVSLFRSVHRDFGDMVFNRFQIHINSPLLYFSGVVCLKSYGKNKLFASGWEKIYSGA